VWEGGVGEAGGDQVADVLGDGGDDGVACGCNHPGGRPMSASVISTGGRHSPVDAITPRTRRAVPRLNRALVVVRPQPWRPIEAVGVGHQEQAAAHVWSTQGAR